METPILPLFVKPANKVKPFILRLGGAHGDKPILRVLSLLRPPIPDDGSLDKAFEIGRSAHEQVEKKFNHGAIKEHAFQFERGNYVIECHPDIYYEKDGGIVYEIKSLTYFVQDFEACMEQLSAYVALLKAKRGIFLIYKGQFEYNTKSKTSEFKIVQIMPVYVPLLSWDTILTTLDLKAQMMLDRLKAEGKLDLD